MKKYSNWDSFEDMINEKNIVPSDEFLSEEERGNTNNVENYGLRNFDESKKKNS